MTEDEKRGLTAQTETAAMARHDTGAVHDPIAVLTAAIDDDPSIAELVAFRACAPDLKALRVNASGSGTKRTGSGSVR